MDPVFRPTRRETVMCTVQGCVDVAAFLVTGGTDCGNSRTRVAAYCQRHAEEAAARLGHPGPIPERHPAEQIVRTRVLRAG
jgi:hypothetical protein